MLCFQFIFKLCVLFFFSLSLATSERISPPEVFTKKCVLKIFAKLTGKYLCWSRPETPAQVFSCEFLQNFFRTPFLQNISGHLICYSNLNHQFFEFLFLLTYPVFIYCYLSSLCIWFCFTYWVITIIQMVLTLAKLVLYVCWLNKLPSSFLFWINKLMQEGQKTWKLQWMFYLWFRENH